MYTIGKLAKEFKISRSTLLYYDSIGLLKPRQRSKTSYRIYNEEDKKKLEQIITFRQMGLPLNELKKMLKQSTDKSGLILENHLMRLSDEIRNLRQQQHSIVKILKNNPVQLKSGMMDKETWKSILRSTGLDDDGMDKWHAEFEKTSPQAHHDFLVSIGLTEEEISYVRKLPKKNV